MNGRIIGSIVKTMAHLVKFQAKSCGTCGKMSHIDHKVAAELDLEFHTCRVTDIDDYVKYREVLMLRYPDLEGVGYPTYIVIDQLENPTMLGSLRGGFDKGVFRTKLQEILSA